MKRILFAAAVALAVSATGARADWGSGPVASPPPPPQAAPAMGGQGSYGWNPALRRLAFWKKDDGCGSCGKHGHGHGHGGGVAPAQGGTLVFPQHQFARSPRDWFMYGY